MRIFRAYWVPRFCSARLHGECNIRARQGIVKCEASSEYEIVEDPWQILSIEFDSQHHWREGNLPSTSKCAYCKKTCWSSECLTGELQAEEHKRVLDISRLSLTHFSLSGYRCEWCGMTTHAGCRMYLSTECNFGILQPIYLPPHSVSIPRTEVPIEAIIGVQVKSKTSLVRDYSCRKYQSGLISSNWTQN